MQPERNRPTISAVIRKTSLCIAAVISFVQLPCFAGGGPENVFLLVNSTSANSMEVANHYVDLRQIPESNVFYLPYLGSKSVVNGDTFRGQILLPALNEIDKRELTGRIDYLVYSCDFPWRINLTSDYPGKKFPPQLSPRGGLTGLTYLAAFVKQKREEVVGLNTNLYFIEPTRGVTISRAFKSKYRWAVGGRRTAAQGLSYIISSMLGVTDDRGNKVSEIVNCLKLARSADGTSPSGTVYYMKHGGPRSKPRHEFFAGAASELRTLGVEAKILPGKFPENKSSIAGLTCGTARAELGRSGCRFLPGAFCDNLTSYGGTLSNYKPPIDKKTGKKSVYQVSVADFIRYGATSACGTVFEPYSIKQKFPVPSVHVHYVNGCSLGESFYQSVQGPYQQLLVGDPLCQPWAKIPTVEAKELGVRGMLRGTVRFTPTVDAEHDMPIDFFELFVDGERIGQCKPGGELQWDTTTTEDGYHEVRIVSVDDTPIATQGRLVKVIGVKNGLDAIGLSTDRRQIALTDEFVTVNVASTVESQVELFCNTRKVGSLASGSGRVRIPLNKLGAGPVEVYAIGAGQRSKSIGFEIAVR